jgi:prepilin-type processing-associated H-X9-DG protein
MSMTYRYKHGATRRRAYTIRDLAVTVTCLLVAGSLLLSVTGATRDLSQTQTCMGNLRQMYAGMTAYVNQYNAFPPNNPYPTYAPNETINGLTTLGWDPSIGWVLTHGLGYAPPATFPDGHFKWYGTPYADLPDVCKCPSMSPALLDPTNPEVSSTSLETNLYQYALSYMTSGTCRAATPIRSAKTTSSPGTGGRNPAVPDPTGGSISAQQADNAQNGAPYVWVQQHNPSSPPSENSAAGEYSCWIQAVHPAEVQAPSRTYYLADSRDYRPTPGAWPPAGINSGWGAGYGNSIMLSARHFGFGNVLYLDGRVSRDEQMHYAQWNLDYTGNPSDNGSRWRVATFGTSIYLANLRTQWATMPVLRVRGWEYFFKAGGLTPQ